MKKTFAKILCFALSALMLIPNVSAIKPVTVESAEEQTTTAAEEKKDAVLSEDGTYAAAPASYIENYGQLVYFDNFSGAASESDYTLLSVIGKGSSAVIGGSNCVVGDNSDISPNSAGIELTYTAEDGAWKLKDGQSMTGTAYFYAEIYADQSSSPQLFTVAHNSTSKDWGAYYTPWDNKSPAVKSWVPLFSSGIDLSKYSRLGFRTNMFNNFYVRSIGLYIKPANAYWISDVGVQNTTMYFFDGDSYTLPTEIGGVAVAKWSDGTNTYDAGTTLEKAKVVGKRFMPVSYATAPAAFSDKYGKLVYYTNFADSDFENLASLGIISKGGNAVKGGFSCVQCVQYNISPNTAGIELTYNDGTNTTWVYKNGTPISGKAYVYAEVYTDLASTPGLWSVGRNATSNGWGAFDTPWDNKAPKLNTWNTIYSSGFDIPKYDSIGFLSNNWGQIYFKSLGLYIMPDNALWLTDYDGNNRIEEALTGDNYTFPTTFNSLAVDSWTDGTNTYAAGASVAKADVAGKTFKYLNTAKAPASYSEQYGQLIYYTNFGTSDFENLAPLAIRGKGSNAIKGSFNCIQSACSDLSPNTAGLELTYDDGTNMSWVYNDGTEISGTAYVYAEVYADKTTSPALYTVGVNSTSNSWGDYYTPWDNRAPKVKTWVTEYSKPLNIPTFDSVGFLSNVWGDVYFKSLGLYIVPDNALWLTDENGENRAYEVISEENYTFPAQFNSVDVASWTDGTNTYKAGASVAKADVAGKTFKPSGEETVKTLNVASIRTSGVQGIRFAAFASEEVRAAADSYGFIVTRKDFLDNNYDNLVFDSEGTATGTNSAGVKYVSGESYNKTTGVDKLFSNDGEFFGSNSLGEGYYFTAILANISSQYYKTVFVCRPYVKKDGVYSYGECIERSIYDVALAIKNGGYVGIDDAAKAYIDSVIDTAV